MQQINLYLIRKNKDPLEKEFIKRHKQYLKKVKKHYENKITEIAYKKIKELIDSGLFEKPEN